MLRYYTAHLILVSSPGVKRRTSYRARCAEMTTRCWPALFAILAMLIVGSYSDGVMQWLFEWWWPPNEQSESFKRAIDAVKNMYRDELKPLEDVYAFGDFYGPIVLDAKPMVLLLGQHSTGKTTFMHYLLKQTNMPGSEIGAFPTTDGFIVATYGDQVGKLPGAVLVHMNETSPFRDLERFGKPFMESFRASSLPNHVLKKLTIVDTPGILAGRKQTENRGYNFSGVCSWFAEQADMIILFFDVRRIDISDQLEEVIKMIAQYHNKLVIVLNKADTISKPDLIAVYGGLMWNLGKVINTNEVKKVYVVSLWKKAKKLHPLIELFVERRCALLNKIQSLARDELMNKMNRVIKRADMVKVHAYLMGHLGSERPQLLEMKNEDKLIEILEEEFERAAKRYAFAAENLPDPHWLLNQLRARGDKYRNLSQFPPPDTEKERMKTINDKLSETLQEVMATKTGEDKSIQSGIFDESDYTDCGIVQ